MAAHFVVAAAFYCAALNPAADKVAGAFPKLLPLQIAVTASDILCVAIVRVPTLTDILGIVSDLATVIGDLPPKAKQHAPFPLRTR